MLEASSYNFNEEYDGADVVPSRTYAVETASIQQNLSLFLEIMDSLGSDEAVKQSEILKELYYGPLNGVQDRVMVLISQFQNNEDILKTLLDLNDCMEEVITQYLRRAGASDPLQKRRDAPIMIDLTEHGAREPEANPLESFSGDSSSTSSGYDSDAEEESLQHRHTHSKDKGKRKVVAPARTTIQISEEAPDLEHVPLFRSGYKQAENPGECPICCDDEVPPGELFIFDTCEHQYCRECLQGYFSNLVTERKVLNITCPYPGCKTMIEYHQVQSVVTEELFQKYEESTFLAALNTDPTVKWCPRPGCGNAIIGDPENPRCVCTERNCLYEFCFLCSEPWHRDATCEQYQQWKVDNGLVDTKFTNWAKKNTKKCPQCKTMIEKIAGCNHMTCSSCKYEFCWLCSGKYSSSHFDVFNVLGCPGMQSGSKQFGVARRMGMRALIGTGLVLGGILGTALAIPAAVVAGPIYGGYKLHQKRKRSNRRRR